MTDAHNFRDFISSPPLRIKVDKHKYTYPDDVDPNQKPGIACDEGRHIQDGSPSKPDGVLPQPDNGVELLVGSEEQAPDEGPYVGTSYIHLPSRVKNTFLSNRSSPLESAG